MTIYDSLYDIFDTLNDCTKRERNSINYKRFSNLLRTIELIMIKIDEETDVDEWCLHEFMYTLYVLKALTFKRKIPHYIKDNCELINEVFRYGHHYIENAQIEHNNLIRTKDSWF